MWHLDWPHRWAAELLSAAAGGSNSLTIWTDKPGSICLMISFEKVLTKHGVGVLPYGDVGPVGLRKVVRSLIDQVRQWHSCRQRLNDIL